jgi:hypothetical protein
MSTTVLDIERSFWESSGDQEFYEAHVADEGKFILSMGVMTKDEVVASMAHAEPWDTYEMVELVEVPITDDVVGLVYEATGRWEPGGDGYHAHILSVYRQVDGEWQLILHQQTPVDA